MDKSTTISENPTFRPAKPVGWIIRGAQFLNRIDLAWRNRLRLEKRDLEILRSLPAGAGIILASNHADETDLKVCLELARRCRRRFLFMANREAFDEGCGIAGWWLERLGCFSVERGGNNEVAKRFAIDVVKQAREVLVVFPEGEIYYLNDLVQPFKSGAIEIGMQALVEMSQERPDWVAYLVPMAVKYRYRRSIRRVLDRRTRLMEQRLFPRSSADSLPGRLTLILTRLLHRQELIHHLVRDPGRHAELTEQVHEARRAVLAQIEEEYAGAAANSEDQTMDRTWRLGSYLRKLLRQGQRYSDERRAGFRIDLAALEHVAHMGSWQPNYVEDDPSQERLAEMVLKLEREVYGTKRPRQLANRDVFVKIGGPIDLGRFVLAYLDDAQAVRHGLAEQLRTVIQALIDSVATPRTPPE